MLQCGLTEDDYYAIDKKIESKDELDEKAKIANDSHFSIYYASPGKYTIADIEVSGIRDLDKTVLIQLAGLKVGETIEVPGEAITNAIKKLWQQGLFSDVRITASKIVGEDIWVDIYLQEHITEKGLNK